MLVQIKDCKNFKMGINRNQIHNNPTKTCLRVQIAKKTIEQKCSDTQSQRKKSVTFDKSVEMTTKEGVTEEQMISSNSERNYNIGMLLKENHQALARKLNIKQYEEDLEKSKNLINNQINQLIEQPEDNEIIKKFKQQLKNGGQGIQQQNKQNQVQKNNDRQQNEIQLQPVNFENQNQIQAKVKSSHMTSMLNRTGSQKNSHQTLPQRQTNKNQEIINSNRTDENSSRNQNQNSTYKSLKFINQTVPLPLTVRNKKAQDYVVKNDKNNSEHYNFFIKNEIVPLKTLKKKQEVLKLRNDYLQQNNIISTAGTTQETEQNMNQDLDQTQQKLIIKAQIRAANLSKNASQKQEKLKRLDQTYIDQYWLENSYKLNELQKLQLTPLEKFFYDKSSIIVERQPQYIDKFTCGIYQSLSSYEVYEENAERSWINIQEQTNRCLKILLFGSQLNSQFHMRFRYNNQSIYIWKPQVSIFPLHLNFCKDRIYYFGTDRYEWKNSDRSNNSITQNQLGKIIVKKSNLFELRVQIFKHQANEARFDLIIPILSGNQCLVDCKCFNATIRINDNILDRTTGLIKKKYPGIIRLCCSTACKFKLIFPRISSPLDKISLISALVIIDQILNSKRVGCLPSSFKGYFCCLLPF
eukprot:403343832